MEYKTWRSLHANSAHLRWPLYNLQVNGLLTVFDALTGETKYKENLKDAFSASAVAADGKVYFSSETGNVFVVKAGPVYNLLAKNSVKDVCMATPAISGNTLFFRTQHFVMAIE
jgi:outer membrane protein assembly factor BamB